MKPDPYIDNVEVRIPAAALTTVFDECDKYNADETGGRLIGTYKVDRRKRFIINVTGIIEPGPSASRTTTSFFQDGNFQAEIFRNIEVQHPEVEHLGNWHTHHVNGYPTLSGGDRETYQRIVNHGKHNTQFFYALLVVSRGDPDDPLNRYNIRHFILRRNEPTVYEIPPKAIKITNEPLWWPATIIPKQRIRPRRNEPTVYQNPPKATKSTNKSLRWPSTISPKQRTRPRRNAPIVYQNSLKAIKSTNKPLRRPTTIIPKQRIILRRNAPIGYDIFQKDIRTTNKPLRWSPPISPKQRNKRDEANIKQSIVEVADRGIDQQMLKEFYPKLRSFFSEKTQSIYWKGAIDLVDGIDIVAIIVEVNEGSGVNYVVHLKDERKVLVKTIEELEKVRFNTGRAAAFTIQNMLNRQLFKLASESR